MTAYASYDPDPTAVMGRRILAYIIDGIVMAVVVAALVVPALQGHVTKRIVSSDNTSFCQQSHPDFTNTACYQSGENVYFIDQDAANAAKARYWAGWALSGILNLVVLQSLAGASIGKLLVGLRVVRGDTRQTAGLGANLIRWLLLLIDGGCCIIGLVTSFTTKGHKRVGDMAAGTLVVKSSAVGQRPTAMAPMGGQWMPPGAQQNWGGAPPAADQGWASPAGPAAGSWNPPGAQAPTPAATPSAQGGDAPQWDAARNAYIQYDRARGEWMQFDDATQAWKPISQ